MAGTPFGRIGSTAVRASPWPESGSGGAIRAARDAGPVPVPAACQPSATIDLKGCEDSDVSELAIGRTWREIESITPPEPIFAAPGTDLELAPKPIPPEVRSRAIPLVAWGVAGLVILLTLILSPGFWWTGALVAVAALAFHLVHGKPRRAELTDRKAALSAAQQSYAALVAEADRLGPAGFAELKRRLQQLKVEYETVVPEREREALIAFDQSAQQRQLQLHLEDSAIDTALIPGLGQARKTTLARHGITSAAQVRGEYIQNLPGFGPVLTTAIVAWREFCVRTFRYNPKDPTTARERMHAVEPFLARRREIETELSLGRDELQRLSTLSGEERGELAQRLAAASQALAQAQLDISAL